MPTDFVPQRSVQPARTDAPAILPDEGLHLEQHLAELELGLLRQALERTGGNRTKAAALLGIAPF